MDVLLVLGLGAIFLAMMTAFMAATGRSDSRKQLSRSLAALSAFGVHRPTPSPDKLERPFSERVVQPAVERLTRLGRRMTPAGQIEWIRRRLESAGNPAAWDVDRVLAVKMIGLLGGLLLGAVVPLVAGAGRLTTAGVAVVLGATGFGAPDLTLRQAVRKRAERIRRDLPDALDLLTISVEAGLTFNGALAHVAKKTTGPLAEELFRVLQEMQIGVGRSQALRALSERTDIPELSGFVTAMVQADAFGIPVASVLRVQSRELRVRRGQRAEEAAQKVPVKMLFPLILCILPAMFLVVVGPAAIQILRTFPR